VDARDNVVHAESSTVVLYGVSDLVVVERDGLVGGDGPWTGRPI
jgi:mannose-1-phosphate guanylyltransferase